MKRVLVVLTVLALLTGILIAKELSKANIKVSGVKCDGCVSKIEKAVSKVEGVETVKYDSKSGKASIEYDKSKTDISKLEAAIAAVGFDAGSAKATNPHTCADMGHAKKSCCGGCCAKEKAAPACCSGSK